MKRKIFGTDGIRGRANKHPMTADMAMRVAMAAALVLREADPDNTQQNRVVIGKDTRLSGYMLEQAMAAGFIAMGMDVIFLGPIPTPAVSNLTRSLRADIGVMISASHNPYEDNGIKLFGADGGKLSDSLELQIETHLQDKAASLEKALASPDKLGKASRLDDSKGRYVEFLKGTFPRKKSLEGLKIVLDCANGAAYTVGPQLLWELEAEVVTIGNKPNGRNINDKCGATDTALLEETVVSEKADIGIALDGDADRAIFVDETGKRIDGDQIMALLARSLNEEGRLQGGGLVATVMSNLGLERYLQSINLDLVRTPVGDRYVVEHMLENGYNVGGEQSGHILLSDFAKGGDGLLTALQILRIMITENRSASDLLNVFTPLPQILENVRFGSGKPLDDETVKQAIENANQTLANDGRLLVRASGTEPVIRVMAEGDDSALIKTVVSDLCGIIEKAAKTA